MHYWSLPLGVIAFAGLLILPGMWVTFCLPGSDLPFWPRFWLGAALSPTVILVQFYVVRALGLPFGATSWLLMLANLAAGFVVWRQAKGAGVLASDSRAEVAAVAIVCAGVFGAYFAHRAMFGHAWMHTDVVYQLANGRLRPEDSVMSGLRLAYPWFGHPQHAVFSYVMGAVPLATYMWPNVAYLVVTFGLTWCIVAQLDGDRHAKVWSLILLLFAVNVVGYWLNALLPTDALRAFPDVTGWRYTPWIRRFLTFEQEQTVVPIFCGLLWLAVDRARGFRGHRWVVGTLLLCSVGVIYTILLPAALAIVGAAAVVLLLPANPRQSHTARQLLALGAMVVVAAATTYATVQWVTQDSTGGIGITVGTFNQMKGKAFTITVVTLPLLLGAVWAVVRPLRDRLDQSLILALAGAGSMALFVIFLFSQGDGNEYKFVFTAAAALAPLAGLAASPILARFGRRASLVTVLGLLVLSVPAFHKWWRWERGGKREVAVDTGQFDLRLREGERFAGATDALRNTSPQNTIIVTRSPGIHLPTLTRRVLYAPYANEYLAGTNLKGDLMLTNVKGYSPTVLAERRRVLHDLFEPPSLAARDAAFGQFQRMERPVGFIVDESRDTGLSEFLAAKPRISKLSASSALTVWLLRPQGD